ncbi:MAG: alginate lyase family protein [Lentisphaerae bacterium]|nr:alginate lyase family protein [Lentisphaerota bacterium]MBT5606211.1 alginate lyase family protein [Lentisphaerota bacterium]MBT7060399.1 alginate lyase family protein [Lentisphaerota bacterium]MBT7844747.1 alginate lyase family protein [Lentisphaerota bacterium]
MTIYQFRLVLAVCTLSFPLFGQRSGLLPNADFEESADGKPTGWTIRGTIGQCIEGGSQGSTSALQIVDPNREDGSDVLSSRFDVPAGQRCMVQLDLLLEEGDRLGLGVYLRLWDAAGKELVKEREEQISRPKMVLREWTTRLCVFEIPPTAAKAALWLHTFSSATVTCRVDRIRVALAPSEAASVAGDWRGGRPEILDNGGEAVRWSHAASSQLSRTFDPAVDWSTFGMVRFRLHSAVATGSAFLLVVTSENPDVDGADYYSFRIVLDWTGWKVFNLPLRELGVARSPVGWHHINGLAFTASGWGNTPDPEAVVLLADWELTSDHRFGPTMDDDAFFAALDLDLPPLADLKQAVETGDLPRARKAYADHVRQRQWPKWTSDWRDHPMRGVTVPKPEEDKDPESWDYYSQFVTVDWKGWKKFTFRKEDFPTRTFVEGTGWRGKQPIGWHWIQYLKLNASGWGLTPDAETVLHFDDIRLVGRERSVTLADFEAEKHTFSGLEYSQEQAKGGTGSGRWQNMATKTGITCRRLPHDWTEFDALELWIHADKATNARFILVLDSDPPKRSEKAEKLIRKEFSYSYSGRAWPITFDGLIDWHANPTEGPARTHLWNEAINRHFHFSTLGDSYWSTGDERYAEALIEHWMDWIYRNPPPLMSSGNRTAMTNCTFQTLTTGIRLEGIWPNAMYRCLGSSHVTHDAIVTIAKSVADQARHLVKNPTGGNWLTEESMGIYTAGMLFPEFKEAAEWRRLAIERLNRQLDEDVYPDGMEVELAAGYSNWVIANFTHLLERAAMNGLSDEIPGDFLARLERAYNYHLYAMMPDGRIPGLNDSGNSGVTGHLTKAYELFPHREDFLFGATRGGRGTRPGKLSYAFPYSGHFVMRSAWEQDAVYALLDSGPFGYGHQHEDKLTFVLYAHGRQLILDPGNYSYDRSKWRRYVLGTHGHNTILVDGEGQRRRGKSSTYVWPKPWEAPTPVGDDTVWFSDDVADFVRGAYRDGYGKEGEIDVVHTRAMVFIKPTYFIILDTLTPRDGGEHEYTSLFHLDDTEATLDPNALSISTGSAGKANVHLLPARLPGLSARIAKGEEDPVQGWANGPWRPVPTAVYTFKGKGVSHLATAVYPTKVDELCPIEDIRVEPTDGHVKVTVVFAGGSQDTCRFLNPGNAGQPYELTRRPN